MGAMGPPRAGEVVRKAFPAGVSGRQPSPARQQSPASKQTNRRRKSESHRHEEAVDAGLPVRPVIPVEDPVVSILAGQRLTDGYAADIAIDRVIVVGDP